MGPHPHPKRKILFLPRAPIKAPISKTPVPAASCGIPAQKPVDGAQTAVDVVRVVKQAGPAAAKGSPTAARIAASRARRIARDAAMDWLASTYPLAFGADVKPEAIGVVAALIWPDAKAEGIKRREVSMTGALSRRASSRAYLEAPAPRTAPCASASTAMVTRRCRSSTRFSPSTALPRSSAASTARALGDEP